MTDLARDAASASESTPFTLRGRARARRRPGSPARRARHGHRVDLAGRDRATQGRRLPAPSRGPERARLPGLERPAAPALPARPKRATTASYSASCVAIRRCSGCSRSPAPRRSCRSPSRGPAPCDGGRAERAARGGPPAFGDPVALTLRRVGKYGRAPGREPPYSALRVTEHVPRSADVHHVPARPRARSGRRSRLSRSRRLPRARRRRVAGGAARRQPARLDAGGRRAHRARRRARCGDRPREPGDRERVQPDRRAEGRSGGRGGPRGDDADPGRREGRRVRGVRRRRPDAPPDPARSRQEVRGRRLPARHAGGRRPRPHRGVELRRQRQEVRGHGRLGPHGGHGGRRRRLQADQRLDARR